MGRCKKILTPTSIVLLGATGDLAQKKLLPALADLYLKGVLPEQLRIFAFAHSDDTTEQYREFAREHIQKKRGHTDESLDAFLKKIVYIKGDFNDRESFEETKRQLEAFDTEIGMCASKLFYLAVPPAFYDNIFEQIAATKLDQPCVIGEGWTRVLVEKPFGSDLDHAHKLEDKLSVLFKEEQIYRIDHYLAKDALQNILAFRFSNVLFEDKWNKKFVESVTIKVHEQFDVSTRGAFFDGVGALRDVGQNHMLQMLALIAMENPETLEADSLRARRAEVLQSLIIPKEKELGETIVKGQYDDYRKTKNVAEDSKTETYFALKTYLNNRRWKGVPFYLEHGKAMKESKTEITVRFRSSKNCVCGNSKPHDHPNYVRFTISPDQKITIRFWVRKPGLKYELEPNDLVFDRAHAIKNGSIEIADAYEEVLFDAICGDQTSFVSNAEQAAAWKYVTAILALWHDVEPQHYTQQSDGPSSDLQDEMKEAAHLFR